MKTVLVTGAGGFVGGQVVPKLKRAKYKVRTLARKDGDLTEKFPTRSLTGIDAIVHLAGVVDINGSLQHPAQRLNENTGMLLNLLEAVRTSGKRPLIVFMSTDRVYGKTKKKRVTESEPAFPLEPYTASKMLCEVLLETYAYQYNIPYVILRIDSIYGPGQPRSMFISDVIKKMREAETSIQTGPLSTKKNFVYVGDLADAVVAAVRSTKRAQNQVYNIGGTENASLRRVLKLLREIHAHRYKKSVVVHEGRASRPSKAEVAPFALSIEKARRLLKWRPKTSLYKGLQKTVEYMHHE